MATSEYKIIIPLRASASHGTAPAKVASIATIVMANDFTLTNVNTVPKCVMRILSRGLASISIPIWNTPTAVRSPSANCSIIKITERSIISREGSE